ncbi:hypothetical protein BDB01DRAFT_836466 [Pilobolus umbonatus]|nr:hypothetical protein BDB01DRAFT_836466 [Pilobolus umbonatus]
MRTNEFLSSKTEVDAGVPFVRIAPSMTIELIAGSDARTENLPKNDEVAVVLPNERTEASFRDVRLYLRGNDSQFNSTSISQSHVLYMPLHYTLLFPMGDLGWNWGMQLTNRDRLEQRMYYRYRLHQRDTEYSRQIVYFSNSWLTFGQQLINQSWNG